MLAGVVDAHGAAGLEHDAVHRSGLEHLLDERQAVLLHIRRGGAERVGVAVAEGVADHQVGMCAAEGAVVRQHDPGLDPETLGHELAVGAGERVAVGVPRPDGRDETMPAPRLLPDRHVARGVVRIVDSVLRVKGGGSPCRVVARRDRHRIETEAGGPGSSCRVPA